MKTKFQSISDLQNLSTLTYLNLSNNPIDDFSPIKKLKILQN